MGLERDGRKVRNNPWKSVLLEKFSAIRKVPTGGYFTIGRSSRSGRVCVAHKGLGRKVEGEALRVVPGQ